MAIVLFMDCGAPSLYNKLSRQVKTSTIMGSHIKNRRRDDFTYVQTEEYAQYRFEYLEFIRSNPHLDCFSNLDVINNAELTYQNQKWFEKRGLKPLPVWHFGEDIKWLQKYLDEGYKYICVGGMVPNPSAVLRPALDRIWTTMLTDKQGMPKVKVHGFAMTSFELMYRWPWYSVDSKSWIDYARYGFILLPPLMRDGTYDWRHPARIGVSDHAIEKRNPRTHFRFMDGRTRQRVLDLLKLVGVPLGVSKVKSKPEGYELEDNESWLTKPTPTHPGTVEATIEPGVRNSYISRMDVNLYLYRMIEQTVPAWPWAFRAPKKGLLA